MMSSEIRTQLIHFDSFLCLVKTQPPCDLWPPLLDWRVSGDLAETRVLPSVCVTSSEFHCRWALTGSFPTLRHSQLTVSRQLVAAVSLHVRLHVQFLLILLWSDICCLHCHCVKLSLPDSDGTTSLRTTRTLKGRFTSGDVSCHRYILSGAEYGSSGQVQISCLCFSSETRMIV